MKQLRADARRNLERVLEAAAEVFAERGPDVSVDEVARRAGVGHATVFRRFPSKDALIAAVVVDRIRGVGELADAALERDDAGEGFVEFAWQVAELKARDRCVFEGLVGRCADTPEVMEANASVLEAIRRVVGRAQEAGAIRSDVDADEVLLVIASILSAALHRPGADEGAWRRHLAIVLDGLRVQR